MEIFNTQIEFIAAIAELSGDELNTLKHLEPKCNISEREAIAKLLDKLKERTNIYWMKEGATVARWLMENRRHLANKVSNAILSELSLDSNSTTLTKKELYAIVWLSVTWLEQSIDCKSFITFTSEAFSQASVETHQQVFPLTKNFLLLQAKRFNRSCDERFVLDMYLNGFQQALIEAQAQGFQQDLVEMHAQLIS